MRKLRLAAVAGLVLAACGTSSGPSADEAAVRSVVTRWNQAVVQRDGPAACAQLSGSLQCRIDRHLLGEGITGKCAGWAARYVSPRHPASRRGARITAVRIHGNRASVTLAA